MKIVEPFVELWKQGDDVKAHVAKCARVCYGKDPGIQWNEDKKKYEMKFGVQENGMEMTMNI